MKKELIKYLYSYDNVENITFYQDDSVIPVNDIIKGKWKICCIENKDKLSGLYFFNVEYISQVYGDIPLKIKDSELKIIINGNELENLETTIDELSIYKKGITINKKATLFVSTYFNKLCGFMIIFK